jgi:hypothetical protein
MDFCRSNVRLLLLRFRVAELVAAKNQEVGQGGPGGWRLSFLFFLGGALAYDGAAEAAAKIFWQVVKLGITINLDGHLSGAEDHEAVVAPMQVLIQFGAGRGVNHAV